MATLRFSSEALAQLQHSYSELQATQSGRNTYGVIVSTLASLERDAALFTLLQASPLLGAPARTYAVRVVVEELPRAFVDISYQLSAADEDVVIRSIRRQ